MIAMAETRPLIVPPSIGRLYLILSPDRLAGVLESALLSALEEARSADPGYVPPCAPGALVAKAREGLALVWSDVEPSLAAFRDGCATARAAKAARDEAEAAERARVIREREAKAAEERVAAAKGAREKKAAEERTRREADKAATTKRHAKKLVREDRSAAEREADALRERLRALETALAKAS